MSLEEFERRLVEYGLDPREAKAYIVLAQQGPKKAGDLAKTCGQSRIGIYRVLKRLQSKGMVTTILSKPMQFAAIPPEEAFEILIGAAREKVTILEQEKSGFLELWASLPRLTLEAEEEKFRVIWGRPEFFSTIRHMCSNAKERICILTTRNGLSRLYHAGVDDQLEQIKGVEVRVLADIDRSNLEAAERFTSICALRYSKPSSAQFAVIDDMEIVVNMALDDTVNMSSEKDMSLWTNSKGFSGLMRRLFEGLWAESVDANIAIQAIESGQSLPETTVIRNEEESSNREAEMIRTAKSKVTILTSSLRVASLLRDPVASAIREDIERGVVIQIMTNSDEKVAPDLLRISQICDLRFVDFKASAETVLVDRFQTMLSSGWSPATSEAAFLTNDKGYGELIHNFLEQVWSNGHDPQPYFQSMSATQELERGLYRIADELKKRSWVVNRPGTMTGSSSVKHSFELVATDQKRVMTIDYLLRTAPVEADPLIAYATKKTDVNPSRAILFVIPGADERAVKIAEFFGVELLQGTDISQLLGEAGRILELAPEVIGGQP